MTKIPIASINKKKKIISINEIKDHLENNHKAYVLITCSYPDSEGKMDVELNYSGDEVLASYLAFQAQNSLDPIEEKIKDLC
ncbi:MAG: hypothetical protein K1060chlam5_00493 [Candidatus Anoxychlamydiales bacterium]|nr:hypothetical protein [Candidatus Anoxychlamydiales bacterium]